MSGRLILAGNVIADLVIEVPALPERGGDVIGTRTELTAGGGFNTLVAARHLGAEAVFAGLHGTGPYGDLIREALAAEQIGTLLPARTDGDTGFTVALVDGGGGTYLRHQFRGRSGADAVGCRRDRRAAAARRSGAALRLRDGDAGQRSVAVTLHGVSDLAREARSWSRNAHEPVRLLAVSALTKGQDRAAAATPGCRGPSKTGGRSDSSGPGLDAVPASRPSCG